MNIIGGGGFRILLGGRADARRVRTTCTHWLICTPEQARAFHARIEALHAGAAAASAKGPSEAATDADEQAA